MLWAALPVEESVASRRSSGLKHGVKLILRAGNIRYKAGLFAWSP